MFVPMLLALTPATLATEPEPTPPTWAVVIGSNRPGPGQHPLRHAHADASRMAEVLTELGGVAEERLTVLLDPDPDAARDALDDMAVAIETADLLHARGLFYYSGHARPHGLDLGPEPLPLADLRATLADSPAAVQIAIIDACQSGALATAKGMQPATAFSIATVQGLEVEGLAILASSTGDELSQELDALGGSVFTHHLITGLRGAADDNDDGRVDLDEAYAYAYDRTVVGSAATVVGRQHPTLETALRGHGRVALTQPGLGDGGRVRIPDGAARWTLTHRDSGTVVAEVDTVFGDPVALRLPAGRYDALVDEGTGEVGLCPFTVDPATTTPLDPAMCVVQDTIAADGKGGGERSGATSRENVERWWQREPLERVALEVSWPSEQHRTSALTDNLVGFGFRRTPWDFFRLPVFSARAQLVVTPSRHLAGFLAVSSIEQLTYLRGVGGTSNATTRQTQFSWQGWRAAAGVRIQAPLVRGWFVPYAQAGVGPARVASRYTRRSYDDQQESWVDDSVVREAFWGPNLTASLGLQIVPTAGERPWRPVGLYAQLEASTAPVLRDLYGNRHDSGQLTLHIGARLAY